MITIIMRLVRTEMLEVMKADYIKFARARGIEITVSGFAMRCVMPYCRLSR
jgi:ABC-type dipeptide/oligopeptide/nickel transport system permease component